MNISWQRRALSVAAVCMTLPYLILKVVWMSGSRIGLVDPAFGRSTSMHLLNTVTICLDIVALALAVTFGTARGRRVRAPLVLLPMWIGAGLLGEVLIVVSAFAIHHPPVESTTTVSPMASWVFLAVYGDFCGLGLCLLPAFALYARDRWPHAHCTDAALRPLQIGSVIAVATAIMQLGLALTGSQTLLNGRLVDATVLLATVGGLWLFRHHGHRVALIVAFAGTGACVAWSCYDLVLTYLPNELVQSGHISSVSSGLILTKLVAGVLLTAVLMRTIRTDVTGTTVEMEQQRATAQVPVS